MSSFRILPLLVILVLLWTFAGIAQESDGQADGTAALASVEASLELKRWERWRIQVGLAAEGFDPGPPDGLFGRGTRAAIRKWQKSRGAEATGYLDVESAEVLLEASLNLGWLDRRLIQQGLNILNYKVGPTDGMFGPLTRSALRKWQAAMNKKATGHLTHEQAVTLIAVGERYLTPEQVLIMRTARIQEQAYQGCLGTNGWQDQPDTPERALEWLAYSTGRGQRDFVVTPELVAMLNEEEFDAWMDGVRHCHARWAGAVQYGDLACTGWGGGHRPDLGLTVLVAKCCGEPDPDECLSEAFNNFIIREAELCLVRYCGKAFLRQQPEP